MGESAAPGRRPGTVFTREMAAPPFDLRHLDPPEPLVRILERLEAGPGPHTFLLEREPYPLYPLLARDRWRHEMRLDERGYVLTVWRAA